MLLRQPMIKCLRSASSIWSNAGRPLQEMDNAAAYTMHFTFTMQTPLPRQVTCCIFCARNVSKLLTSYSYQEISSYLYDALITSVCINTFLRRICRSVLSPQRLGFYVLYSPFKTTLSRVYKSQCTVMTIGTHLIYC